MSIIITPSKFKDMHFFYFNSAKRYDRTVKVCISIFHMCKLVIANYIIEILNRFKIYLVSYFEQICAISSCLIIQFERHNCAKIADKYFSHLFSTQHYIFLRKVNKNHPIPLIELSLL